MDNDVNSHSSRINCSLLAAELMVLYPCLNPACCVNFNWYIDLFILVLLKCELLLFKIHYMPLFFTQLLLFINCRQITMRRFSHTWNQTASLAFPTDFFWVIYNHWGLIFQRTSVLLLSVQRGWGLLWGGSMFRVKRSMELELMPVLPYIRSLLHFLVSAYNNIIL